MKKRNRVTTIQGLNKLPLTAAKGTEGYETRKEFIARDQREQKNAQIAAQKAIDDADPLRQTERAYVDAMTALALQTRDRLRKLYRDVETVKDYIKHDIEALVDDIGLPTQNPPVTMNEFETRIKAFVEGLPTSVTFSDDAKRKFELYAFVAARQGAVIDNSTLQAMLERCESLDFGITLPKVIKQATVKPTPTPTWDDTQDLSTENRDQRKKVLEAVGEDFTSEVAAFVSLWQEQLQRDYDYFIPDDILKRALQYVSDFNLPPLRHETWNIVRRAFVRNGWFPAGLLTERERLSEFCSTADLNSRDVRLQIARRNWEIQESERPFAPHK